MKVYTVNTDTNYRLIFPDKPIYPSREWQFKGDPLIDVLPKQFHAHYESDTDDPIPDIAFLGMKTFAFKEEVATELSEILEEAGEILPFWIGDKLWYFLNILDISKDSLIENKCEYEIDDGETRLLLKKWYFDTSKITSKSLFKIPNDNFTFAYCIDRRGSDEEVMNNFFCAVAAHGYTGLEFKEVFSDE